MSYCRKEGKDDIIFVTKDDFESTEVSEKKDEPEEEKASEPSGLILPNGDINWDCPCLQGMGKGPCGEEFKDAFSCFHYSDAEPKGSDCLDQFKNMQECFVKFPEVYGGIDDDENEVKAPESEADPLAETENAPTETESSPNDEKTSLDGNKEQEV